MASMTNQNFNSMSNYGNQPPGLLGSGAWSPGGDPSASLEMYSQPNQPNNWAQSLLPKPLAMGFDGGAGANPSFLSGMLGSPGQQGWGSMALGGAQSLASAFMGMKQYGLAKQQLAENKRQFDTNFSAQKGLTNSNLEDRQRARVASNPGAYESVGSYMNQNGVK